MELIVLAALDNIFHRAYITSWIWMEIFVRLLGGSGADKTHIHTKYINLLKLFWFLWSQKRKIHFCDEKILKTRKKYQQQQSWWVQKKSKKNGIAEKQQWWRNNSQLVCNNKNENQMERRRRKKKLRRTDHRMFAEKYANCSC